MSSNNNETTKVKDFDMSYTDLYASMNEHIKITINPKLYNLDTFVTMTSKKSGKSKDIKVVLTASEISAGNIVWTALQNSMYRNTKQRLVKAFKDPKLNKVFLKLGNPEAKRLSAFEKECRDYAVNFNKAPKDALTVALLQTFKTTDKARYNLIKMYMSELKKETK